MQHLGMVDSNEQCSIRDVNTAATYCVPHSLSVAPPVVLKGLETGRPPDAEGGVVRHEGNRTHVVGRTDSVENGVFQDAIASPALLIFGLDFR